MAKKKQSHLNPLSKQHISLDIDYDKLAEAIIRAQNKIIEKQKGTQWRKRFYRFFNGTAYLVLLILSLYRIYSIWVNFSRNVYTSLPYCIGGTVALTLFGLYAFLCQQETFCDDYETTLNQFNSIIALVALIISIIALVRGAP